MPFVDRGKCAGCGACVGVCPVGAITMQAGKAVIDQGRCIKCGKCVSVCPQNAIRPNSESSSRRGFRNRGLGRRGRS